MEERFDIKIWPYLLALKKEGTMSQGMQVASEKMEKARKHSSPGAARKEHSLARTLNLAH